MNPEGNGMTTESRWRVLVFPGGTEIGLGIWNALRHCKDVVLHSAAADVSNHAPYVFARHFILPGVHEPGWLAALNALVERLRIDYIFPAHDDLIAALAAEAPRVRARVVSSPPETCLVTRSKRLTYRALRGIVPVPNIYADADAVGAFPVFVKPDRGQGSKDAYLAQGRNELRGLSLDPERTLLLEYLPGDEYTVDCFSDREIGLLFSQGRQRVRTRSGIFRDVIFEVHRPPHAGHRLEACLIRGVVLPGETGRSGDPQTPRGGSSCRRHGRSISGPGDQLALAEPV